HGEKFAAGHAVVLAVHDPDRALGAMTETEAAEVLAGRMGLPAVDVGDLVRRGVLSVKLIRRRQITPSVDFKEILARGVSGWDLHVLNPDHWDRRDFAARILMILSKDLSMDVTDKLPEELRNLNLVEIAA